MKWQVFRHLQKADPGSEPEEQDLGPAEQAVEQSRLALEKAQQHDHMAEVIAARARRVEQRNGFGQLLEKLTEPRESGRIQKNGHGGLA